MNPEMPAVPRELWEQKITAWLLGELSAEEAAGLQERIAADAELAALAKRLEEAILLVRATTRDASSGAKAGERPRLSSPRRDALLAHFKTVAPVEFQPRRARRFSVLELAACLAIFGAFAWLLWPTISPPGRRELALGFTPGKEPETMPPAEPAPILPVADELMYQIKPGGMELDSDGTAPAALPAKPATPAQSRLAGTVTVQEALVASPAPVGSGGFAMGEPLPGAKSLGVGATVYRGNGDADFGIAVSEDGRLDESRFKSDLSTARKQNQTDDYYENEVLSRSRLLTEGRSGGGLVAGSDGGFAAASSADAQQGGNRAEPVDEKVNFYRQAESQSQSAAATTRFLANDGLASREPGNQPISDQNGLGLVEKDKVPARAERRWRGVVTGPKTQPPVALYGSVVTNGIVANNSGLISDGDEPLAGEKPGLQENTRAYFFSGGAAGGGGGGGGGKRVTFETESPGVPASELKGANSFVIPQNDRSTLGFEWYLGKGEKPTSDPGGRQPAPESQAHSLDVVGYVNVPQAAPATAVEEYFGRESTDGPRVGGRETVASNEVREKRDELLTGGLRAGKPALAEAELAKKLDRQPAGEERQVEGQKGGARQVVENPGVVATDAAIRRPVPPAPIPQPEILTRENSFSTFSLNVSDVSFQLAAASLGQGQMPDRATIRSEEFINAFNYHDPEARAGAPLAFAWERARYPFAHNRDLLRFAVKAGATGRPEGRALNLVLVLDNSGSMERADRVRIVRAALKVLAGQLQPQDRLSIVTFARTPHLVVDGVAGNAAGEAVNRVAELTPEGGTNLEAAMKLAYQTAARHNQATGNNRVVLLTDGAANLGEVAPESLERLVQAQRQQGIALDCFGVGWEGYNDDLLEVLSRHGDGRYGFINSPEAAATEFASQLAGALQVAAADVKVQVEFNPQRVTSYRQIGYARHQLTKEQFRDNTVDAAEIAAQEAGNALYTVEVNPAGAGPVATVRARYKVPGTTTYREQAWDVPYTGGAPALPQSSPALRLAAVAGAFSEWLAVSPFASEVSPDALLSQLGGIPDRFPADPRPKQLEWMIRQAKSLNGK